MTSPTTHPNAVTKPVTITVNGTHVTVPHKETTGAAIIQASIAAGLAIEADFVLYARHGDDYRKIEPDEHVTVHAHEIFRAVAPDDVA
jgi:hypothetical protein